MATDQDSKTTDMNCINEVKDGERQYLLLAADDDKFVQTGRQIIDGCRLNIGIDVWVHECDSMFDHVSKWATERTDRIVACYAVPRGAGMCLFFIPSSESFDFDLADQLAELNSELIRTYCVGPVEIHQIPTNEMPRFIAPNTAREVYPNAQRPHNAMAS